MSGPILFQIEVPKKCEICQAFQLQVIYDAVMRGGGWAYMCEACWREKALWKHCGVGKGQKYIKNAHGMWEKAPYGR